MKGAIFFSSKYGSTEEYAEWIAQATDLPVFNVNDINANPAPYDFLILGSPIIYYKLIIHKWVKKHLVSLANKPIIFFSVSGAPAGEKLDGWITNSLPKEFITNMRHVALRGRQIPEELTLYDSMMLRIGALFNRDPKARKEELEGFDFMEYASIEPVVVMAEKLQGHASSA